jgi:hypothetical protein
MATLRIEQWIATVSQASNGHALVVFGLREGAGGDQPLALSLGTRAGSKHFETVDGQQVELVGDLAEDRARAGGAFGQLLISPSPKQR